MTAVLPGAAPTLPWMLRRSTVSVWHELPRVAAAGGIWLLTLAPVAAAATTGLWWLIALSTLPAALASTSIGRFAAALPAGARADLRDLLRGDPVLALAGVVTGTAAERLISAGGLAAVAGSVLAALLAVVAPIAIAYGAVRGKRGLLALRGGMILVAYRPSTALTVLALACIGGFAIAASVGALATVVPCLLAAFSADAVSAMLREIDARSGAAR